jgi:hypothetical protein
MPMIVLIGRVAMMMSRVRSTRELCAVNTPCRRHRTRPFHYQPLKIGRNGAKIGHSAAPDDRRFMAQMEWTPPSLRGCEPH